jgi:hypothetical protein
MVNPTKLYHDDLPDPLSSHSTERILVHDGSAV